MKSSRLPQILRKYATWLALSVDFAVCMVILFRVKYTEIDFSTYMQQVNLFEAGERNYYELKGDTGPLVYPAGFLYIYSAIKWLSHDGSDLFIAQMIFTSCYLLTSYLVLKSCSKAGVPVWLTALLILSRRTHSIYILRLFNDGICSCLSQACVYFLIQHRWVWGCVFLSLAVSVKMNALLFAPGVAFLLFQHLSVKRALALIVGVCGGIQLVLGLPFLLHDPVAYLHKAFELSRVFTHKWSANFQFLSTTTFESKQLSLLLLSLTICTYLMMAFYVWPKHRKNALLILYTSNFVGIVFSRTIHYQFYSWYSFTLPALVYFASWTRFNTQNWILRLTVLVGIEAVYNWPGNGDNPATPISSLLWQALHYFLLLGLCLSPAETKKIKTK